MPYEFSGDNDLQQSTNKTMFAGTILMVVMVLIFPLYLSIEPTTRSDARATQKASLINEGSNIFEGEGISAPALNSKQFLKKVTDKEVSTFISVGVPGSAMPAWSQDFSGPLTSGQITSVTAYLRSLEPNAPDRPDWRSGRLGG